MRVVKTPSWSRNYFSPGSLAGTTDSFWYGPSFWLVPGQGVVFNDSGIRRRKRRRLKSRKLVERTPLAIPILSGF